MMCASAQELAQPCITPASVTRLAPLSTSRCVVHRLIERPLNVTLTCEELQPCAGSKSQTDVALIARRVMITVFPVANAFQPPPVFELSELRIAATCVALSTSLKSTI